GQLPPHGGRVTNPLLRRPGGRQGPGRMPQGLVDELDLIVARRSAGALPGDRRAAGLGTGTELAQLRPYEVGDDVRQIDAAATARTGEPHVRLQVPERTLTTWVALDVSPSMAFGTADRLKSDVAESATRWWRSRCAIRARARCPPWATWPWWTPRLASTSRWTPRTAACASASSAWSTSAASRWRASCAGCAWTTWCSPPTPTGCVS